MINGMWRKNIIIFLIWLFAMNSFAQSSDDFDRIMKFTGCENPEELDEHEVERLSAYLERPMKINLASPASLRSCGLFTAYQSASLLDYRSRHGDVMSYGELSSVDGFTAETVSLLSPFISLDGGDISLRSDGGFVSDLSIRGGMNFSDSGHSGGYALKYRCSRRDILSLALSASRNYSEYPGFPDVLSGHIAWTPPRKAFKVIVGDFNARFGQGLALWNGMSMTGISRPSSVFRSASGLSTSWSFTGSSAHTGLAVEYSFSRMRISSFLAFPGVKGKEISLLPALNIGWYGKNMSASLTHYIEVFPGSSVKNGFIPDMKTSVDMSLCVRGVDVFSELSFDWVNSTPAALTGIRFTAGEGVTLASHIRFYPASFDPARSSAPRSVSKCSNEYGLSLCLDYASGSGLFAGTLSLDSAYLPESKEKHTESIHLKISADGEIRISRFLVLKMRMSERIRTWGRRFKTDLRADILWASGRFSADTRLNLVKCAGFGFLSYVEGGYKTDRFSLYLRHLLFIADEWEDRIYAYERDAPGSFSVPAFYGRGMHTALTASWKFSQWGRVYVKGTVTSYPFEPPRKKKPGKAGLKLQFVFSF